VSGRILRENITTSETLDACTPGAECFFYRLLTVADDYGLMDARLSILRARCYPLRDKMACETVQMLLDELTERALVLRYEVDGKPFLAINKWDQHQRIQTKKPRHPFPPPGSGHLLPYMKAAPVSTEAHTSPRKSTVDHREPPLATVTHRSRAHASRPPNPNPNPNPNPKSKTYHPPPAAQEGAGPPEAKKGARTRPPKEGAQDLPASGKVWLAYQGAYLARYGAEPVRNATINGQISNLVARLGVELAPLVAAFYLTRTDPYYMQAGHPIKALLGDAEKLATAFRTSTNYTPTGKGHDLHTARANTIAGLTGQTPDDSDG
jgi:hypothetical protein